MKNSFNYILMLMLITVSSSCASDLRFSRHYSDSLRQQPEKYYEGQTLTGECSYYAHKFHGRPTASGEIFDMHKLSAAHKKLPFGTIMEVENLSNGKKVRVRVNDRGPFKPGRILDLSLAAAKKIDLLKSGTAKIRAVILKLGK